MSYSASQGLHLQFCWLRLQHVARQEAPKNSVLPSTVATLHLPVQGLAGSEKLAGID